MSIIVEYLKRGLEQKEKCVYIADENSPEAIIDELKKSGIAIDSALTHGDFVICGKNSAYLRGGSFDPDSMIEFVRRLTATAKKEGYKNLRVTGEMTWALSNGSGSEKLMEYEARLNNLTSRYNVILLCQYDLERFGSRQIVQSIQTHPTIIYKKELCDNGYYIPPEEFLRNENTDDVMARMLENIIQRKRYDSKALKGAKLAKVNNRILEHKISDREKTLRVFKESESYFRRLINSAPVAIILTDTGGRCLFANNNWQILTGLSLQESIGAGWQKIIHPDYVSKIGSWWYRGEKKETDHGTECLIQTASGYTKWIDLKSSPLLAENGDHVGYISSFTDVTHRKENEHDMLRKIQSLENGSNNRDDTKKLIPICSCCKKIRDLSGVWIDPEEFISARIPADFSHGFCPNCKNEISNNIKLSKVNDF